MGSGAASDREYINVSFSNPAGKQAARSRASDVHREYDFGAMTLELPAEAREGLENNPNIEYIEENGTMTALSQTVPYGIEQVDADLTINDGDTGDGASIAIVDSGVGAVHETLEANLGEGYAPAGAACEADCDGGWGCNSADIQTCYAEWDDDNNHGTHVAGTAAAANNDIGVLGVAPAATIHPVKVLGCCGSGGFDDIAAGIEWAANQGIDVINLSLGGPESELVNEAVEYAVERNAVIVAAAGNEGPCSDCVGHPAAHPDVIAVSATDETDSLASFSSTGPEIDIAAPGDNVLSTIPRDEYAEFPGTSMASPHVAGAAATLIADGVTDRNEVKQKLLEAADDVGLSNNEQGAGRLNVADAVSSDSEPSEGSVSVSTGNATTVEASTATLNGELTELDGVNSADVHFEYGVSGGSLSNSTTPQTVSSTGTVSQSISGLNDSTTYEFRAVATGGGDSDVGAVSSFTTDEDGGCFITTATVREQETLDSLRRFRDQSMATSPVGRAMVGLYYRISPPIADTLDRHPASRTATSTRRIIQRCASLSDQQAETESRAKQTMLGVMLTMFYIVGLTVATTGHAAIRTKETVNGPEE